MFTFGTQYDWYNWCFTVFGACFVRVFPLLLPVALPPFTPTAALHEITHRIRIRWYTSGYE